jgi:hypothetical protein
METQMCNINMLGRMGNGREAPCSLAWFCQVVNILQSVLVFVNCRVDWHRGESSLLLKAIIE